MRLPTRAEVEEIARATGVVIPSDLIRYLIEASDVVFGTKEPVTLCDPNSHTHFPTVLSDARDAGVSTELVPICEDNGDYYCMTPNAQIIFWSHDGKSEDRWRDLAEWIERVWIGES